MVKKLLATLVMSACAGCAAAPQSTTNISCDTEAGTAVAAMVAAHGGMDKWQQLSSIYVEREHLFAGTEQPIRFDIHGEYPSHRIFQTWRSPSGSLAWDGERAWSSDWPLAGQLMPRYVAGIGFYLLNLPWLVHRDAGSLESRGCSGTLPERAGKDYLVIVAAYEPDPVRKPAWFEGPRDTYELYIDPDSQRLSAVMQHWTYAGRLDSAGLPQSVRAISQLFVPDTYVEANGLLWPHTYRAYTEAHELAASGRFFGFDFARPVDAAKFDPAAASAAAPDTSSSYLRRSE